MPGTEPRRKGRRAVPGADRSRPDGPAPLSDSIGAVQEVARAASAEASALDPASVALEALPALARITGLDACTIYLADRAAGVIRCIAQRGYPDDFFERFGVVPLDDDTLTARAIRTGEPQYSGMSEPLAVTLDVLSILAGNTFIVVPFRSGGEVLGTVNVIGTRDSTPTVDEIALLQIVADQIGHSVRAAQLQRQSELSNRRAAFLAEISRSFNATLNLQQVLDVVAERATGVLGDWCVIYLRDREHELMRMSAVHHPDPARTAIVRDVFSARPVRVGEGVAGTVVLSGEMKVFPEFGEAEIRALAPRDDPAYLNELRQVKSWACLPLFSRGTGVGALVIATVDRKLTDTDLDLASAFAEIAAAAIANARLYDDERMQRAFAEAAHERLQEADRQKDEFLSVASHELRTPLTSAQGFTQVLLRRATQQHPEEPRQIAALTTIETQLRRMAALLNDLLDFTHIQSGALPLHPRPIELGALVQSVAESVRTTLSETRISVSVPETPIEGTWDGDRIEQVLVNLLENAVKYSPDGGPIDVVAGRENGWATVRVRDSGLGIPVGSISRLFHRFYRVPGKAHQQISGIGIGLYICRQIAERHGGTIEIEQPDGPGSIFVLRLPLNTNSI